MLIVSVALAFILSAALVPFVISFARRRNLFDNTGRERKNHVGDIPRLGGVAVFIAFTLSIGAMALIERSAVGTIALDIRYWPVFVGAVAMFILGLVDDIKSMKATPKAIIQFAVAVLVTLAGFRFRMIPVPIGDGAIDLGFVSYPLTILWIVGITNAMNLIDGMDGMLGGVTVFAAASFGIFFFLKHDMSSAGVCLALVGAALGFLVYNKPKATIFMGDAGSLFIGFTLAVLPLLNQTDSTVEIGFISAVVVLGIPIMDTIAAISRRMLRGVHPFTPDRGHIHHMLMDIGDRDGDMNGGKENGGKENGEKEDREKDRKKQWSVLLRIYPICGLLGITALSTLFLPGYLSFAAKILSLIALCIWYFRTFFRLRTVNLCKNTGSPSPKVSSATRRILPLSSSAGVAGPVGQSLVPQEKQTTLSDTH